MAEKNDFLTKQRKMQQKCWVEGINAGRQQMIDLMSLVLHDPAIMGKDTFGCARLLKVTEGLKTYLDEYYLAWQKDPETDYVRAKLDAALADIYGPGMHNTFAERYEFAPEFNYKTGKWT